MHNINQITDSELKVKCKQVSATVNLLDIGTRSFKARYPIEVAGSANDAWQTNIINQLTKKL